MRKIILTKMLCKNIVRITSLFVLVFMPAVFNASPVHAANINVGCSAAELIAAIDAANATPAADTLELAPDCVYSMSAVHHQNLDNEGTALPAISTAITIYGNNATIGRAPSTPNFRFFEIEANGSLSLQQLTLHKGGVYNGNDFLVIDGGAIWNAGTLDLQTVVFSQNRAAYAGGAVWNSGTVHATASKFDANDAFLHDYNGGGAIYTEGALTITDSTFQNNHAGTWGGAIRANGATTISGSTFFQNSVDGSHGSGGGGAIYGGADVTNSTFVHNLAGYYAIGSAIMGSGRVNNSTFFDNPDTITEWRTSALLDVTVVNSIMNATNCDNVTDGGGNLQWGNLDNNCPGIHADPKLGPLQNNGGPTDTLAIPPDSAATNAGLDAECEAADQRGIARPQGVHCDIGAYEIENSLLQDQGDLGVTQTGTLKKQRLSFFLHVSNDGPLSNQKVILNNALPRGVTFRAATSTQGSCKYIKANHRVRCRLHTLAPGAEIEIRINVERASNRHAFANTANVRGSVADYNPQNNASAYEILVP